MWFQFAFPWLQMRLSTPPVPYHLLPILISSFLQEYLKASCYFLPTVLFLMIWRSSIQSRHKYVVIYIYFKYLLLLHGFFFFFYPFLNNMYFLLLENPSLNSYAETWIPSVVILGGGAFGKWLSHEEGALMNEVNAFIKETPPAPPPHTYTKA